MFHLRTYLATSLFIGTLLLGGCQTPPAPTAVAKKTPEQLATERFTAKFQQTLLKGALGRNDTFASGTFALSVTVNDKNEVIDCTTERMKNNPSEIPYSEGLAQKMISLCWTSVLPDVPEYMFGANFQQTIVAPLVFGPSDGEQVNSYSAFVQVAKRDNFFWTHLFSGHPIDSIGIARIRALGTAQGEVQECEVTLEPHPLRRRDFKQDNVLLDRLTDECKTLDISKVIGFSVDKNGVGHAGGNVEYTPWKDGLKKTAK